MPHKKFTPQKSKGRPKKLDGVGLRIQNTNSVFKKLWMGSERVTAQEQAKELNVNVKTARNLNAQTIRFAYRLSMDGSTIKVNENHYERNLHDNFELKLPIARTASAFIQARSSAAVVAGSTVALTVKEARDSGKSFNVLTNNLSVIGLLGNLTSDTVRLAGGPYRPDICATIGDSVIKTFKDSRCSVAIIGVSGIDINGRLWVRTEEEIGIMSAAMESAQESVVVVADISKFLQRDSWQICDLSAVLNSKHGCDDNGRPFHLVTNPIDVLDTFKHKFNENQIKSAKQAYRRWKKIITEADGSKEYRDDD